MWMARKRFASSMNGRFSSSLRFFHSAPKHLLIAELCIFGFSCAIFRRWPRDQTMKAFIGRFTRSSRNFIFAAAAAAADVEWWFTVIVVDDDEVAGVGTPGDTERGERGSSLDEFEWGPEPPTERCAGTNRWGALIIQLLEEFVAVGPRCDGTCNGES